MTAKKYRVHLTGEEQGELKGLVSNGRLGLTDDREGTAVF